MRLKLDENLGKRGRALLLSAGHEVVTVFEQRLAGAPDRLVLNVCRDEGRALVTLDLEYADPLRFPAGTHGGIAVLHLPRRPTPSDLTAALETLAGALSTRSLAGERRGTKGASPAF